MSRSRYLRRFFARRWLFAVVVVLLALAAGLALADRIVAGRDLDWDLIERLLYYQTHDVEVFEVVDDPDVLFAPKPGAVSASGMAHINSLGYRGRELTAAKPEGVFRILVVGGSNVYGMLLWDDETWPAQLEEQLNRDWQGRFEVFNGGVLAYVPSQMAIRARVAMDELDPDLIVFALSNVGSPAFLAGSPIRRMFETYPVFWQRLFYADYPTFSFRRNRDLRWRLLQENRLYRFFYAAVMGIDGKSWYTNGDFEQNNIKQTGMLIAEAQRRGFGFCLFLYPGAERKHGEGYSRGYELPIIRLDAQDLPRRYGSVHPPATVMTWYAKELSRCLEAEGLLGEVERAAQVEIPSTIDTAGATAGEMVDIPTGMFVMGCSPGDALCRPDEKPPVPKTVSAFHMDRTEVTAGQYRACVAAGACETFDGLAAQPENCPVVSVSKNRAMQFCRWAGKRLPTEVEWEYAARAGDASSRYGAPLCIAWFDANAGGSPHPVGRLAPNAWGLHDMYGNVWEWTEYSVQPSRSNQKRTDQFFIVRGGGWFTDERYLRASYRTLRFEPEHAESDIGFRCAQDASGD